MKGTMSNLDYWKETLSEGAEECGLKITEKQLDCLAETVQISHENYSMYSGDDVADANFRSESEIELEKLKKEIEDKRVWEVTTKPCEACTTTGCVKDGWGRDMKCYSCDGKGRY